MSEGENIAGLRAVARALVPIREPLIDELLSVVPGATIGASLFLESFFERLALVAQEECVGEFAEWLSDALRPDSPLRPARGVATALGTVLVRHVNDAHDGEADACLREIQDVIVSAFSSAVLRQPSLDEVDASLDGLVNALHSWDALTAEHSRAVGSWCGRIARSLGLGDDDAAHLSRAGLVHDLGKARVPAAILQAPRALEAHEWQLIHEHVRAGDTLAREYPVLEPYRDAIGSHHERLDGSGYPTGKHGDEIPFNARVVAVADSFNAMIGHRPYRAPLTPEQALAELRRHSGTQFDPEIVGALASVLGV